MSTDELLVSLEEKVLKVHTQAVDISFNELLDMYENDELNITPDYQRLFRWSLGAQSRFIESLLLEMPVPPIYVVEEDDGRYLLIDGLQRFSSYLHLRSLLKATHLNSPVEKGDPLIFQDCDIVKDLNGMTFDDLPMSLKIRLKRSFIRMEVVRKGSDSHFKYHMFKRLNTGGEDLTPQQLRNCTIRMLSHTFIDHVKFLVGQEDFKVCISNISNAQQLGGFDEELVLRFFALKNYRKKFVHDVADFLTEYMEEVSDEASSVGFEYEKETEVFNKTFKLLNLVLGDKIFGAPKKDNEGFKSNFNVYHFESICCGIQTVIDKIDVDNNDDITTLSKTLTELKFSRDFIDQTTGGGKNSKGLLDKRVTIVSAALEAAFS
jgi:uncharacterized protein with ParB-like and HNH nuclease domain